MSTKILFGTGIFRANQTTKCLRYQGRTKGEGLVDQLKLPDKFIAGRDFRCGALLFMVILVIYKYKIGKNSC